MGVRRSSRATPSRARRLAPDRVSIAKLSASRRRFHAGARRDPRDGQVGCAAGTALQPLAFCQRGKIAAAARFGSGSRGQSPSSRAECGHVGVTTELAHEAVDDAARWPAREHPSQRGVQRRLADKRVSMHLARRRFRAEQISRADLDHRRAECACTGDARAVGNAAGGDDRDANGSRDLRQQREQAALQGEVVEQEMAAMTAASSPWTTIASTPRCSSHCASATVVALARIFAPVARTRASRGSSGRPK
jgi:hypothetical protein